MDEIRLTFHTTEGPLTGPMARDAVFHEALEHLLPEHLRVGRRITIRTPAGEPVYPDMFIGETADHYGSAEFVVQSNMLREEPGPWRNVGFDHIALAVRDRAGARGFFGGVLRMAVVRDDPHQTVLTTGHTTIFLFDAQPGPLNPGIPSHIHHIGFVVDDLEAAWHDIRRRGLRSDYMVLERDERWSLYFFHDNGDVRFLIQLSEIKEAFRGFADPRGFTDVMYDYARGRYGVRFAPGRE